MKKGIKEVNSKRICGKKRFVAIYRLTGLILIMSILLSGCTNIVTGETNPKDIDFTKVNEDSGLTKLGIDEGDSLTVNINYAEGADFDVNKYESVYVDAFYVAPDLSDSMEDISYFNLLDTFEAPSNGTTFVYAYRTKAYAGGTLRNDEESFKVVDSNGEIVMFPELRDNTKLPVSDKSYLVLATYSFATGKSSYHEIARIESSEENLCQSKVTYHTDSSLSDISNAYYTSEYYSLLDKTNLYIFDANNVKYFSDNRNMYILNNAYTTAVATSLAEGTLSYEGEGQKSFTVTNSAGTSDFSKITKAGFYKIVNFEEELAGVLEANSGGKLDDKWDIDIYDYSVYVDHDTTNIFFETLLVGEQYGPDASDDAFDPDSVVDKIDESNFAEDESDKAKSYDYVGNITITELPDIEYTVEYYCANEEIGESDGGHYNYIVWPSDADDNIRSAVGSGADEVSIYSKYFGSRVILLNEDGSRPLDLIKDNGHGGLLVYEDRYGHTSQFKVAEDVSHIWHFKDTGSDIEKLNESKTETNYKLRNISSSEYIYGSRKYLLVSSDYLDKKDSYFSISDGTMTGSYVIGDLGIKSTLDYIKDHAAALDNIDRSTKLDMCIGSNDSKTSRKIGEDNSGVLYNIVPDLKLEMKNAVLHNTVLKRQESKLSAQFLFDDIAMLYNAKDGVFYDSFPVGEESSLDYYTENESVVSGCVNGTNFSETGRKGTFKGVRSFIADNALYQTYIYDDKVLLRKPQVSIPSNGGFKGGPFTKSVSNGYAADIDLNKMLVKGENNIDANSEKISLGEIYKGGYLSIFNAQLTREESSDNYIVSSTPTYGLGLYNPNTNEYVIPTFQRHKITQVGTTMQEGNDNKLERNYDMTKSKDEIVALRNIACYGIYTNNFTVDKDIYPYLLMGYDRDDITYTDVEMIHAKMIPFGVAFKNSEGYYRDFTPVEGEECVYYLRDVYYATNGSCIVDKTQFGGDVTASEVDPYNPKDLVVEDKTPDNSSIYDNNKESNPKPTTIPKPTPVPTSTPAGTGADENDGSNNGGKGVSPTPSGNGFNGIVSSNDVANTDSSIYNPENNRPGNHTPGAGTHNSENSETTVKPSDKPDGDSIFDESLSDNSISDQNISKNGVSDNEVSDNEISENETKRNGSNGIWPWIITIVLLSRATIVIYKYKNRKDD